MRAAYVELEPRSSGKRSSDEGPSWTGEVPAATRQHLKTELALGTSSTTTVHKGLRGRPGREVGMSLTYDGQLSMVGPVVPQSPTGLRGVSAHRVAVVQAFQPGEDWRWCYFDEALI
jgi:hypothetical protein